MFAEDNAETEIIELNTITFGCQQPNTFSCIKTKLLRECSFFIYVVIEVINKN